jgi:1-aminocyclopropane-1-carboxylate deaminase/D-cysteine desulfhydrase-like pyridoxal-dependent ACC family enzyme
MNIVFCKEINSYVLQDHDLKGGTKSIFIGDLLQGGYDYYVYASPVYGAFQIALSLKCQELNKQVAIFCAKRKVPHEHTLICKNAGARIFQVNAGYLNVVQSKAKEFCLKNNGQYLVFGADCEIAINAIAKRMSDVSQQIGEPDIVVCVVGSGTLAKGILKGTQKAKVIGVQVGREVVINHQRFQKTIYPKEFEKDATITPPFTSVLNYDAKGYEWLLNNQKQFVGQKVLFWNVY